MRSAKILTAILSICIICVSFSSCAYSGYKRRMIDGERAIEIATGHFGLNADDCKVLSTELDDGKYDIEFIFDGREYDVEVDAYSEKVRERDVDHIDKGNKETTGENTANTSKDTGSDTTESLPTSADGQPSEMISVERAKELVCEHFGVNKDECTFTSAELDGREYEIEFIFEGREYEAEVNVYTGKVTETDVDRF